VDVELIEIRDFLASHPPFDRLPEPLLEQLPRHTSIRYLRRGAEFPPNDGDEPYHYLIRSGAVEVHNQRGELLDKYAEGDLYTGSCSEDDSDMLAAAAEDTLAYRIPCRRIQALREQSKAFNHHFEASLTARLRNALYSLRARPGGGECGDTLMGLEVSELIARPPVCTAPSTSIREAAALMAEQRVSALMIAEGERLLGLITNRDLCTRCVAQGMSTERPVRDIMTADLHWVSRHTPGFEALIAMARFNVHHLPVMNDQQLAGMISITDLMRRQSADALYLVGDIYRSTSVERLVEIGRQLPTAQAQMTLAGASATHIGQAVSGITDAFTKQLLSLAEQELGPPPVPYAWVVGGSQARREQSSHSDQDNALILADEYRRETHDEYFAALAKRVCDGLDACGYIYCPGEVMATNPKWRQPLAAWRRCFHTWIHRPEPMALMLSSVFFDLRHVHGDDTLLEQLQEEVLQRSRKNGIFLAYMTANALKHRPPLGFFRNFVLIHGGEHHNTLDLKHRGLVPIIDIARVAALSAGLSPVNTLERLQEAGKVNALSEDGAANLEDAFELIGTLRIQHQAQQIRAGEVVDNYLKPSKLSSLERSHLKDAFGIIHTVQEALGQRYQTGRFV
jgi:CBS domain-containing protein